MGESEGDPYPFYEGWWKWAKTLNKIVAPLTIVLALLAFLLHSLYCIGGYCWWWFSVYRIIALAMAITGAIIYLVMSFKPLKDKNLTKKMHIGLLIATILVVPLYFWAGILMELQFVMVGILSDKPFWVAFGE